MKVTDDHEIVNEHNISSPSLGDQSPWCLSSKALTSAPARVHGVTCGHVAMACLSLTPGVVLSAKGILNLQGLSR